MEKKEELKNNYLEEDKGNVKEKVKKEIEEGLEVAKKTTKKIKKA